MEDRKVRLRAQRDQLRKAQEAKRQEELAEFQAKTETKSDLFAELKSMDANLKRDQEQMRAKVEEDQRRLEMYRKLRADMKEEEKQEKEANY